MNEVELPLVSVLRDMELAGVRLNRDRLAEIDARVREEIHGLEREIWDLAGEEFVIGSPQQLGAVLFDKLELSKKRRGKTGFSTDARVLQAIRDEHPIVPKIERWRELNQILKTYLDVLPQMTDAQSRIHTTFVQAAATTGRLSSTNPNMQNVPVRTELGREIRGCFEAAPGQRADLRRLLAGRAAGPGATSPTSRCSRRSSCAARTSTPRPASVVFASRRGGARRRGSLEVEDGQLRDRLRPQRLRPRRPPQHPARGGQGASSTPTSRAFPAWPRSSRPRSSRRRAGLRDDAVRPAPPDPRAARAQLAGPLAGRAAGRQHGHPGHGRRRDEARDDRLPPRAGRERPEHADDPHDPRRAALRRARPRRPTRCGPSSSARCSRRGRTARRRWRSTSASGRPGWRRSRRTATSRRRAGLVPWQPQRPLNDLGHTSAPARRRGFSVDRRVRPRGLRGASAASARSACYGFSRRPRRASSPRRRRRRHHGRGRRALGAAGSSTPGRSATASAHRPTATRGVTPRRAERRQVLGIVPLTRRGLPARARAPGRSAPRSPDSAARSPGSAEGPATNRGRFISLERTGHRGVRR